VTSRLDVDYPVSFGRVRPDIRRSAPVAVGPPRLPRVTRLMALALRLEQLVRSGAVKDYATLAQLGGVSRARVTQIVNLVLLAPDLQEELLFLPALERGRAPLVLADLQPLAALADWSDQRRAWRRLCRRR